MKSFETLQQNFRRCRQELGEFDALLNSSRELSERDEILPFFKERDQLTALIGQYDPLLYPNLLAYEYDIFGDFKADVAIGDSQSQHYCFVEMEDAKSSSLFKQKGAKASLDWSDRFEHGYSQIIDWFWKLADMESTAEFRSRFGENATYQGILIIGRSANLNPKEQKRLQWRREKVIVDSRQVYCVTYDELYEHLNTKLGILENLAQSFVAESTTAEELLQEDESESEIQ